MDMYTTSGEEKMRLSFDFSLWASTYVETLQGLVCGDTSTRWTQPAQTDTQIYEDEYWEQYIDVPRWKRTWAPFFLSDLDWDWDLAESLEQLYALEDPIPSLDTRRSSLHVINITSEGDAADMWHLKTTPLQLSTELPKEVRIPYKSEAGELRFRMYNWIRELPDASTNNRMPVSSGQYEDPEEQETGVTNDADVTVHLRSNEGTSLMTQSFSEEMSDEKSNSAMISLGILSDSEYLPYDQEYVDVSRSSGDLHILLEVPCTLGSPENQTYNEELHDDEDGDATEPEHSAKSAQVSSRSIT